MLAAQPQRSSLSLSLSRFARGLAPRFRAAFKLPAGEAGFSLLGALAASAIGLLVIMGQTQSFIQQKISLLALEKRIQRLEINRRGDDGAQLFMGKAWDCKNTLKGKKLSGSSGDAKRTIEIAAIKDSAAAPAAVWDFSKNAAGELTSAATKQKLKSLGIDKFEKLELVYKAGPPAEGRIVLKSKTSIQGLMERENKAADWELSGITVTAKTAAEATAENLSDGAGDYVTACSFKPVKEACGPNVAGAPHPNGGGFVAAAAKANVASTAFIGPDAAVCGAAHVKGNARVYGEAKVKGAAHVKGNARVYGKAQIYGGARIYGHAHVFGNAKVYGKAQAWDHARIYGDAKIHGQRLVQVYGFARVYENAEVWDYVNIYGSARVYGQAKAAGNDSSKYLTIAESAQVFDKARVWGKALIKGDARVFGKAIVESNAEIGGSAKIYGSVKIHGGAKVYEWAQVYGEAEVYETAKIEGFANVYDKAHVYGNARVYGSALVGGPSVRVHGSAHVRERAHVKGAANVCSGDFHAENVVTGNAPCLPP